MPRLQFDRRLSEYLRAKQKSVKIMYKVGGKMTQPHYWLEPENKPLLEIAEEFKHANDKGGRDFVYKRVGDKISFTLSYRNVKRKTTGVITRVNGRSVSK